MFRLEACGWGLSLLQDQRVHVVNSGGGPSPSAVHGADPSLGKTEKETKFDWNSSLPPLVITLFHLMILIKMFASNNFRNTNKSTPANKAVSELETKNVSPTTGIISLLPLTDHGSHEITSFSHAKYFPESMFTPSNRENNAQNPRRASSMSNLRSSPNLRRPWVQGDLSPPPQLAPGWWPAVPAPGAAWAPCSRHPRRLHCTAAGEVYWAWQWYLS